MNKDEIRKELKKEFTDPKRMEFRWNFINRESGDIDSIDGNKGSMVLFPILSLKHGAVRKVLGLVVGKQLPRETKTARSIIEIICIFLALTLILLKS